MVSPVASSEVSSAEKATQQFVRLGWGVIALVFGGLIAWSVFAPFEGAVLTQGQIAVESNQQAIQHLEGGIVREIYVREADEVKAGQKLIALEATATDASVQAVEARLFELLGTEARLLAERDNRSALTLRSAYSDLSSSPRMASILKEQLGLKSARSSNRITQVTILDKQIDQLSARIKGMRDESASKDSQITLLDAELKKLETLNAKLGGQDMRILALQRESSRIGGERDSLKSQIAATQVQIGEARSEIARLDQAFREEVLTELRSVQTQIGELTQERTASLDRQRRLEIIAPRSGRVIGIRAHTIGGIINPSEPVMYIVPEGDPLVARVRISPADIDKITIGQSARLLFTAFNQDQTPRVDGTVTKVSADAFADEATGMTYYEATITIPVDAMKGTKFTLVPGMPVDAQLRTGKRSVLSYLVKPLTDSMSRTFRE